MHEDNIVVCSPSYAETVGLNTPADLRKATLLHQFKADLWRDMLATLDLAEINPRKGPKFDQYAMVIEATLSGLGVAVIPSFLVESHLASGRLVQPVDATVRSRHAYYLVYPEAKRNWKSVKAFRRWIFLEARRT
jgi:LysR family transcriptional regulator, glycine cleavage system transcriptional activator